MKKVGILGGTFNPPHIGHCIIANEVLHKLKLDEVRLMPNATPPHKKMQEETTDVQRIEMVRLAIQGVDGLKVEPFEIERGGVSYSYMTMLAMKENEPDCEFYFIIGGDSIDSLHTWYKIDELIKIVKFIGVKRPGSQNQGKYPVQMIDIPEIDLSSSIIRNRFKNNDTVQFLLPKAVEEYIRKEHLYGT